MTNISTLETRGKLNDSQNKLNLASILAKRSLEFVMIKIINCSDFEANTNNKKGRQMAKKRKKQIQSNLSLTKSTSSQKRIIDTVITSFEGGNQGTSTVQCFNISTHY